MRITTKDLIKINELKRQYKLEGTTDEIINEDLTRCENCGEICLKEEIEILTDWRNEKYKACEKCQEEHKMYMEDENREVSYDEYMADQLHELKMLGDI